MALIISSLDKKTHQRQEFDCGEPALNEFLHTRAAKHQELRVSRTFVLTQDSDPGKILGYYTLSNCQIARETISPRDARILPHHPIPAVLLARLGTHVHAQGQGLGELLLMDVIKRCALIGQQTGVYALVVDAKHERAKRFYEKYGFSPIETQHLTLYLPLNTALQALQSAAGPVFSR